MSTHTPGPWFAGVSDDHIEIIGSSAPNIVGNIICEAPSAEYKASRLYWEANARLIAAAPELLEALNKILACMPEPEDLDYDPGQIIMDVERIAYAAIDKATGEKEVQS